MNLLPERYGIGLLAPDEKPNVVELFIGSEVTADDQNAFVIETYLRLPISALGPPVMTGRLSVGLFELISKNLLMTMELKRVLLLINSSYSF